MEERSFKGIWIPKEIWITDELSLQEKVVLVEIDSLDDEETGCYASNKYFADFFKLTNGRISQIIKQLQEKGYLDITYKYKGKEITERLIKVKRPPYPEVFNKLNRGIKYSKEGYLENYKENNISNNKLNNKEKNIKKKVFTKPTLEEVEEYCISRDSTVDAKKFFDYYDVADWEGVKNWKQKLITWESHQPKKKVDIDDIDLEKLQREIDEEERQNEIRRNKTTS